MRWPRWAASQQALTAEQVAELAQLLPEPATPSPAGLWYYGGLPGPRVTVSGSNLSVDMSAYRRPTASGTILGNGQIRVTFPDDNTFIGTLGSNPMRINWNNNTVWTKAP